MDIVARLRLGGPNALEVVDAAADTIDFLRTEIERLKRDHIGAHRISMDTVLHIEGLLAAAEDEIDRLGVSLNKCHEQMMRRTDDPVHGPELGRSLLAGGRYCAPECGGFQGFED